MRLTRLVLLVLFALWLPGCGQSIYREQSYVFGTLVEVSIQGEPEAKARRAIAQVLADFDELHRTLHAWEPGTLQRVNGILAQSPARAALPPGLLPILEDARRYSVESEGLFNPAIGNLVALWGFHSDTLPTRPPDPAAVESLVRANPQMTDIVLDGIEFEGRNPAVRLDLGGYAKGYALGVAARYLRGQGVRNALINIGGNILALGSHGDRPWRVGIKHPRKAGAIAELDLHDGEAIGTSGDYQRYLEFAGKRYCHLIDPRTGWPAQGVQAVTVVARGANAGVRSDVASKPIFIAGAADWRRLAQRMGVDDVLRIDIQGRIEVTPTLARRLHWVDPTAVVRVSP